jgi:hypothetical protein
VPFGGFAESQEERLTNLLRAQRQKNEILDLIRVCERRIKEFDFACSNNYEEQVQKHADACVTWTGTASKDCGRKNTKHHVHDNQISNVTISYRGG